MFFKKKMKRIIAWTLCLVMLFSSISFTKGAEEVKAATSIVLGQQMSAPFTFNIYTQTDDYHEIGTFTATESTIY